MHGLSDVTVPKQGDAVSCSHVSSHSLACERQSVPALIKYLLPLRQENTVNTQTAVLDGTHTAHSKPIKVLLSCIGNANL